MNLPRRFNVHSLKVPIWGFQAQRQPCREGLGRASRDLALAKLFCFVVFVRFWCVVKFPPPPPSGIPSMRSKPLFVPMAMAWRWRGTTRRLPKADVHPAHLFAMPQAHGEHACRTRRGGPAGLPGINGKNPAIFLVLNLPLPRTLCLPPPLPLPLPTSVPLFFSLMHLPSLVHEVVPFIHGPGLCLRSTASLVPWPCNCSRSTYCCAAVPASLLLLTPALAANTLLLILFSRPCFFSESLMFYVGVSYIPCPALFHRARSHAIMANPDPRLPHPMYPILSSLILSCPRLA